MLHKFINRKQLTQSTIWNFLGQGVPLIAAFFTIPILIDGLGLGRFGTLTLVWVLIGYASILDFGLGRALTQLVAQEIGENEGRNVSPLVSTALLSMMMIGGIAVIVFWVAAGWLARALLHSPPELFGETSASLRIIALSLPFLVVSTGLRGVLEAYQRFDLVNIVRLPLGLLSYIGPLIVLPFSHRLDFIVVVLVAGRIATVIVYSTFCYRLVPQLNLGFFDVRYVRPLLAFGSWMTVSNVISPLMLYLDRFLIAGLVSVTAVAYYTTPYEVVTRLWIVPGAILGVMFPAFSYEFSQNRQRARKLYFRSLTAIFAILLLPVLGVILFAKPGLSLWLGPAFAEKSFVVFRLLAVGVLLNSLAQASAAFIQAAGRPAITAKLHLLEILPYLTYLWFLVKAYGIVGAATAWLIRVALSFIALGFVSIRFNRASI